MKHRNSFLSGNQLKINKFQVQIDCQKILTRNIWSKVIQYQYMNTPVISFDKSTLKTILINENHFQVWHNAVG